MADPSIERFHRVVAVAHAHLEERRQEINALNVIPVPDGDTGDNMAGTMKAVLDALEDLRPSALAQIDRSLIVTAVAHAALMGARGNSGVILSQVIRGAASVLTTRRGELVSPRLVRDALDQAAAAAHASVREPQPGTILTVIEALASTVGARVDELADAELDPGTSDRAQDEMLAGLLGAAIIAGLEALQRTQEQNETLAEAEVVDAGAYGLMVILGGLITALAGHPDAPSPIPHYPPATLKPGSHWDSRYSHCTSCIVTGAGLEPERIVPLLDELGDSVAVVGDQTMLKVHVHTDEPGRVRQICERHGAVDQFEATDMHEQVAARTAAAPVATLPAVAADPAARTGLVAVASGEGVMRLYGAEGAQVVDGGATLNPSINEILTAIAEAPGDEVIVLPNSPNVIMAAEEAAALAERPVRVVASRSQQAGLAAIVGGFDPAASAAENATRLEGELAAIATGLVAEADRDDTEGRFRRGEAVGFVGSELVAWGEPGRTLGDVVGALAAEAEIVTVLEGAGAPLRAGEVEVDLNGAELEVKQGGQPTYWWLIAAQ